VEKLTLTSAKLTGNPGTSGWAQVHEFAPEDVTKLAQRGHLFAVVATSRHEEGVDSVIAGRELLARLHEEYFGKDEGEAFNVLKSAIEKVISEFRESWGEVEVAAVAFMDKVVYSAVGGGAQVSIFRNGMLAKILESSPNKVVSASGYPKEKDILLLATKRFFEIIPNGVLKGALEGADPATAAESLAPSIHAISDNGNIGAVVIKFEKETFFPKEEVEVPPEVPAGISMSQKARVFLGGAVSRVQGVLSRRLPERKIYVRGVSDEESIPQSKKMTMSVGIVLLVILLISIGFGIRQKVLKDQKSKYGDRLTQAQHEIDEAIGLASLNAERSRELFGSSLSLAETLKAEGVKDPQLEELITKLESNRGTILGEYRQDGELYMDLSILSDGLKGDDLSGSSDRVYVLDKSGKKVVGITLATKKTEVVAGPDQLEGAAILASYEDRVFILTGEGIFEVGDDRTKAIEKDWEGEAFPYAYAGNIYLLDKAANTIWRFAGAEGAFGSKTDWLGEGVEPDFSRIVSVTIDGNIWVLSQTGKILKFSRGSPQNVAAAGVVPSLAQADAIYTNEELGFVYILDKGGKRVVVLDKDGNYKAQYFSDKAAEAIDLMVSEKEKKIILLAGSKLYFLELKHL
jgi:hypothetical protein